MNQPSIGYVFERLRRGPRRLEFIAAQILWQTGACRFLTIQRNGYVLKFFPTAVGMGLWQRHEFFDIDDSFLRRYLKPGDSMIDVGANIGTHSLLASHLVGPTGSVLAIEPHPKIFSFLQKNVSLNGCRNVELISCAVGERKAEIGLSNCVHDDRNFVIEDNGSEIRVAMRTLDEILGAVNHLDLLKIDVEGYEKMVLEGASNTLARTRLVFIECYDPNFARFGYAFRDLYRTLAGHGFSLFGLHGDCGIRKLEEGDGAALCENRIAVRDVDELLRRTGLVLN